MAIHGMEVTLLGTGSPIPMIERGGTGVLVSIDAEPILVDCGSQTVRRLMEHGLDPAAVETLFFTHHHVDHNADFFQLVLGGWTNGRQSLEIFGPRGTESFVDALYDLYEDDIGYREWFGLDPSGIRDLTTTRVSAGFSEETASWAVSALPVEHSIETYAYRFDDLTTGQSCVVSGDTRRVDALVDFADDADLLIQDATIGPVDPAAPVSAVLPDRVTRPMREETVRKHRQNHCDATDAGEMAAAAGVRTLVLTHLLPHRDQEAMRDAAEAAFDGRVIVAEDGVTLTP